MSRSPKHPFAKRAEATNDSVDDHPHGGGRGKSKGNRHPVSPWGTPVSLAHLVPSLAQNRRLTHLFFFRPKVVTRLAESPTSTSGWSLPGSATWVSGGTRRLHKQINLLGSTWAIYPPSCTLCSKTYSFVRWAAARGLGFMLEGRAI